MQKKVFYMEWGVEGSKMESIIIVTEMSGSTIKAGFASKASAVWIVQRMGEVVSLAGGHSL